MAVRAKMRVKSATFSVENEDGKFITATLEGVNNCVLPQPDPEDENSIYGSYSPQADLTITCRGPAAEWYAAHVGKCVYVDFTSAPD